MPTVRRASPNPALLRKAKSVFDAAAGRQARPFPTRDRRPNRNMTDATIANAQKMIGNLGSPVSFVQQQASSQGNVSAAIYVVTFKNGQKIDFLFAVDAQGKVSRHEPRHAPTSVRRMEIVLFDLDDTLHDDTYAYHSAAEEVAREVAAEHGIDALALKDAYIAEAEGSGTASPPTT